MPKIVLTDGRVIQTTQEQQDRLAVVILTAPDLDRVVKLGSVTFKLNDIESDPKRIIAASQGNMFDITPVKPKKKINMG